jgi:hypothetical protein
VPEIKLIPRYTEVFDDVGNIAAGHIAGMPREGDKAIRSKRIRVMPVAAGIAQMFATDLAEATFQLTAVECGIFTHGSCGENELVAECGRDRSAGLKQSFKMGFGSLLKTKGGFATVASVCMAARQQPRFGNPDAVFIPTNLQFCERNNHSERKLACFTPAVKQVLVSQSPNKQ